MLLTLSVSAAEKTQYVVYLSFNLTLQLINGISSDLRNLLECFSGTAIATFFAILFAPSATVFLKLSRKLFLKLTSL